MLPLLMSSLFVLICLNNPILQTQPWCRILGNDWLLKLFDQIVERAGLLVHAQFDLYVHQRWLVGPLVKDLQQHLIREVSPVKPTSDVFTHPSLCMCLLTVPQTMVCLLLAATLYSLSQWT